MHKFLIESAVLSLAARIGMKASLGMRVMSELALRVNKPTHKMHAHVDIAASLDATFAAGQTAGHM
eukprot:1153330-Pelagomonas_calceolata.AAC.2